MENQKIEILTDEITVNVKGEKNTNSGPSFLEISQAIVNSLSLIAIPVVLAIFGGRVESRISDKNLNKDYVELAINILTSKETVDPEVREWAVDLLNENSPTKMSLKAIENLKSGKTNLYKKEKALSAFDDENYDDAIANFNEVISTAPEESAVLYSKRGYSLLQKEKFPEALKDFDKAIELEPTNAANFFYKSLVYYKQGEYKLSNIELNKVIRLSPTHLAAYNNMGLNYIYLKDTIGACSAFEKGIKNGSKSAKANHLRYCNTAK